MRLDAEDRAQLERAVVGLVAFVAAIFAVLVTAWVLGTAVRIFLDAAALR